METLVRPAMRDALVRFQRGAIKETGRRPLCVAREPMPIELVVPGCQRPGFAFWQPVAWPKGQPALGENGKKFHVSIREYLSLCQFLEFRFTLPVAAANSPLSFLHGRVFEAYPNTTLTPPAKAFDDAVLERELDGSVPLKLTVAATCDHGEPLLVCLSASDGSVMIAYAERANEPLSLRLQMDRLLPKLQFIYDL